MIYTTIPKIITIFVQLNFIMMKKKLNLKKLNVSSFVTDLKSEKEMTVQGGIRTLPNCRSLLVFDCVDSVQKSCNGPCPPPAE